MIFIYKLVENIVTTIMVYLYEQPYSNLYFLEYTGKEYLF